LGSVTKIRCYFLPAGVASFSSGALGNVKKITFIIKTGAGSFL